MINQEIKPFLKWVGGKTQIIDTIIKNFPQKMDNYHDIFLGGGSTLIALLNNVKSSKIQVSGKIYAYDINCDLINVYMNVQKHPIELYNKIMEIINEYNNINTKLINKKPKNLEEGLTSQESYYYWIRYKYNNLLESNIYKSAMFIFLNKTC